MENRWSSLRPPAYSLLIYLTGFLTVSALLGGVGALTQLAPLPAQDLFGSPVEDLSLPGLLFLLAVGSSALAATVLLIRRHRYALHLAAVAGSVIVAFEFSGLNDLAALPGPAATLQRFYLGLGAAISLLAVLLWAGDRRWTAPTPGGGPTAAR